MAAKTIEAILRLSADVAGALAGVRQVRAEAEKPIKGPAGTGAAGTDPAATAAARKAAQDRTAAVTTEERALQAERQQQARASRAAERLADQEALAAKRAALRAQAEAERTARRQLRQEEEEERRRKRKGQAQQERDELQDLARSRRAQRNEQRKLEQVAPQVTDIVTSLAGGQNPLLVALQQGGQLRDIFGGLGNAGRALLGIFTPMRVLVGGVAAAVGTVVFQLAAGYFESERLRKSLALSGNAAGTSLGQINSLAQGIAGATQTSIGTTRAILEGLLGVAGQTSNTLADTGRAAAALAKLSGASAEEAVKAFADQADGITDWAIKSNKAYNFLTAEQVAYVRRLESQGRTEEATRFVNAKLADTLVQRTGPALGTLEKAWSATTRALSAFLDGIKAIGRDETAEDRLKKLQERLEGLRNAAQSPGNAIAARARRALPGVEGEINTTLRDQLRGAEAATDTKANQQAVLELTKGWQQSLTAVTLAEAGKRLQGQLAALDKLQAAVELSEAQGLTSERDKALALNKIDQDRLRAQIELQRLQASRARAAIDLEAKPQDRKAAEAAAIDAESQLVATQGRLQALLADARRIVAADITTKARDEAQAWAEVWQRASDQVRQLTQDNALTAAGRNTDPAARAEAEAQIRRQDLQSQVEATARDLKVRIALAISPDSRNELRDQLGALLLEGSQAMNELARRTKQTTLQQAAGEQLQQVQQIEQQIDQLVTQGAITTEEAERRKFAARDAALPQLRTTLELLQALATTDGERNAVAGLLLQLDQLSDRTTEFQRTMRNAATSGLSTLFTDLSTDITSADQAFGKFAANFARRMLELLNQRLAEQLVGQAVEALKGFSQQNQGGQGFLGFLGSVASAFVATKHTGGLIDGAVTAGRSVAPWIFHGAQVLHSGGIAGLRANEQPAILEKGEEVLTADDPRHRNNLKAGGRSPLIGNLSVSVSVGGGSTQDAQMARLLADMVKTAIEAKFVDEMRPGGMLQNVART